VSVISHINNLKESTGDKKNHENRQIIYHINYLYLISHINLINLIYLISLIIFHQLYVCLCVLKGTRPWQVIMVGHYLAHLEGRELRE